MWKLSTAILVFAGTLLTGPHAIAASIISTVAEYNGDFEDPSDPSIVYPLPKVFMGTFLYSIPSGASIVSATISGTFGNLDVANTTALSDYFVNGGAIKVAGCDSTNAPCFSNDINQAPVGWTYTFTKTQLSALTSGSLDLSVVQDGAFSVQSGPTTLSLTVSPEPASALLLISGFAAIALRRRKF